MVFHWSLSDSRFPQVSRTFLSIIAVLNNAVVWIVSTRPPTFKSSSPFNNPLVTLPKPPITMFYSFFQFPSKVEVFILLFTFFQFYSVVSRNCNDNNFANCLFFCWLLVGLVFWPRAGDPCVCQSPKGVYVCHFLGQLLGMHICVIFWPFDSAQNAIQGDAPEGSDTFQWQLWEEIAWAEIGWWNGTR